jgi:hypothetical protein
VIALFKAGYAMSSKLISEIGSKEWLSGSLGQAGGSEWMMGENLSKRPTVERNSEHIGSGFVVELDATRRTDSSILSLTGY